PFSDQLPSQCRSAHGSLHHRTSDVRPARLLPGDLEHSRGLHGDRRPRRPARSRTALLMDLTGLLPWAGLAGAKLEAADVVVAGIPYDGSAAYRKGAAKAPERIRALSPVMPPVTEDGRHLFGLAVHDLGDLDAGPEIEKGWRKVADRLASIPGHALLTVMGGDHCSPIPVLA